MPGSPHHIAPSNSPPYLWPLTVESPWRRRRQDLFILAALALLILAVV